MKKKSLSWRKPAIKWVMYELILFNANGHFSNFHKTTSTSYFHAQKLKLCVSSTISKFLVEFDNLLVVTVNSVFSFFFFLNNQF